MIAAAEQRLLSRLIAEVPELVSVYEEHIDDYDEVLPMVLGGDFVRAMASWEADANARGESSVPVDRALRILEEEWTREPEAHELIALGFVENLLESEPEYLSIQRRLGPALSRQLNQLMDGCG